MNTLEYRSCKVATKLRDRPLRFPICVPTYSRPENGMTRLWEKYPELPVVFFVREEQKKLYKPLADKGAHIVYLKGVKCIGATRRAICEWAVKHGCTDIFLFDDRVLRVSLLAPRLSRTGRVNMGTVPELNTTPDALRLWEYLIWKYKPVISGCAHSGYTWDPSNVGILPKQYGVDCQIAIHLSVKRLAKAGIAYKDVEVCGSEDAQINFDVLEAGLPYMVFGDLEYNSIPSQDGKGGIAAVENNSRIERFEIYCDRFMKNICGEGHPGVHIRKDKTGVPYIRFKWKYWRERNGVKTSEPSFGKYQGM